MNRLWKGRFRWGRLLLVWLVFLLLAGALFAERSGVQYTAAHVQIGAPLAKHIAPKANFATSRPNIVASDGCCFSSSATIM